MPRFALTFDDGPGPSTLPLLDVLARHRTRATFFLLGRNIDADMNTAIAVARAGHVIGSHSYAHHRSPQPREFVMDVERGLAVSERVVASAGASQTEIPFRLPYGIGIVADRVDRPGVGRMRTFTLDPRLPLISTVGLSHVHWSGVFDDWLAESGSPRTIANAMLEHVELMASGENDSVLCLHDADADGGKADRTRTVGAVDLFLTDAAARGWSHFVVPRSCAIRSP